MPIINFSIPRVLEQKISQTIKVKGFPSKAEFFRFAVIKYIDEEGKMPLEGNPRFAYLSGALESALEKKYKKRNIPSIKKQLSKLADL
ncbi:MAG: hypothetical protein Q8P32_03720 [Candidatus Komeilibacteria bacterium]|nr:hypothetical protein [Candidatus Komeilibacteria bacterium]